MVVYISKDVKADLKEKCGMAKGASLGRRCRGVKALVTVSESVSENTEIVVKNSGELEQIILDTHILLVAESGIKVQIHQLAPFPMC